MTADANRKRSRLRTAAVVTTVVLATAFVALLLWGLTTAAPGTSIDEALARGEAAPAPAFRLEVLRRGNLGLRLSEQLTPALADGEVSVRELRGTPFVLNFWASWCVPCREEAPLLQRRWEQARKEGVLFVGLNMQDVREDARAFLGEFGLDFLNIRDEDNSVARRYEMTGIPETFFVTARGQIVGHVVGVVSRQQLDDGIAAARRGRPRPAAAGGDQRPTR
jgi:cytochrome c biogenesis protein CcmG, thiol:disulfide interchange protein DsbE